MAALRRRRLLGLAQAGAALAAVRGLGAAEPGPYALAPDFARAWALHRTRPAAAATQTARGVELAAGSPDRPDEGLALWARRRFERADFVATFDYTRLDEHDSGTAEGVFTCFYWAATGEGSARWPADVSAWTGYDEAEGVADLPTYARHARGARLSFDTRNAAHPERGERVRGRLLKADGSFEPLARDGRERVPFPTGGTRAVTILKRGDTVTFTAAPAGGPPATQILTHPTIAGLGGGWVGFRAAPGRRCRIEAFSLAPA
jgi:hypothetical protein